MGDKRKNTKNLPEINDNRKEIIENLKEQLKEEKVNFLDRFFEFNLVGFILVNQIREIIRINEKAAQIFEYTPEELEGENIRILHIDDESFRYFENVYLKVLEIENVSQVEKLYKKKSGESVWISLSGQTVELPELGVNQKGILWVIEDISSRKNTALKLKKSEEERINLTKNYEQIISNSLEGLYIVQDGTIQFCNNRLAEMYGYKNALELVGKKINDLIAPESIEMVKQKIKERESGKSDFVLYEYHALKKNGDRFIVESLGNPISYKGRPAVQGAMRNITEKKESEIKLRKSEEAYRSLAENIQDLLIRYDKDINHIYMNKAAFEFYGLEAEEIIGKSHAVLDLDDETVGYWRDQIKQVFESGKSSQHFIKWKSRNKNLDLDRCLYPEKDERGNVISVLGVSRDITNIKEAEVALYDALDKAQQSDRLKSQFLANLSHEIRTPLNSVMGFSELLQDDDLSSEEREEYIKVININGNQLINVITDIIELSKVQAGVVELEAQKSNVNDILTELYLNFQTHEKVLSNKVELLTNPGLKSKDAFVITDPSRFRQILTSLISNALKYTNVGRIEYGYKLSKNEFGRKVLEFFVKDTGIGIDRKYHDLIFTPFTQADGSSTRQYEGPGLGLSISKAFVELMGGRIWLESEPGQGSDFYFTVPYNSVEEVTDHKDIGILFLEQTNLKNKTILIVEDTEDSYYYLSHILMKNCKDVIWAKNGIDAINEIKNNSEIDAVLMDIKMPTMNGIDATREIRKFNKEIPIVAQTAHALDADKENALDAGCNDYIAKPIKREKLFQVLSKYI